MAEWTLWVISGVAVRPVPIAHTGSYAITNLLTASLLRPFKSLLSCKVQISSFNPSSYSSLVSPMHKTGIMLDSWIFFNNVVDFSIAVAKYSSSLGVTNEYIVTSDTFEHWSRHCTRVSSRIFRESILSPELDTT